MIVRIPIATQQHSQMIDITAEIQRVVAEGPIPNGVAYVFCPHTTAGLTINEHADPSVAADILDTLDRMVPWRGSYRHSEGNAAAHIKSSLLGHSVLVPVEAGRLVLGTWQGIFFCEFDGPRSRRVLVELLPASASTREMPPP